MKNFFINYKIKEKCKQQGISVKALCEEIGMTTANMYRQPDFKLESICKMMVALDCSFEDLFEIIKVE